MNFSEPILNLRLLGEMDPKDLTVLEGRVSGFKYGVFWDGSWLYVSAS